MRRAGREHGKVMAGVAATAVGAVAAGAILLWPASQAGTPASDLPASPDPALSVPEPKPLSGDRHLSAWTPVRRAASARSAPNSRSAVVARVATTTPEGTTNLLLVLGRKRDAAGRLWVRARLPVLPNGTTGWLPRRALGGYELVRTRLVVDLRRLRATLLRDGRAVFRAGVGIGLPQWPTPRGEFYVRNKLVRYRSPFYGPIAFGTSARSETLTDWPDGGFVGIHGTNSPDLLPGRVSHGCIRMRNEDILKLGRLMPVGTPLSIR
jgi:lipoprotein-anchoring transpeptidase ErfK/SrfK